MRELPRCTDTSQHFPFSRQGATHPIHNPLHAPVADPGLTKNLPSNSNASKLLLDDQPRYELTKGKVAAPVGTSADEHVHVHLSSQRGEHVRICRRDYLLSMNDSYPEGLMGYGEG